MNNVLGFMKIRVKRGINLAIRDYRTSDPYVVVTMGRDQKVKSRVIRHNCNPNWNDELTLIMKDIQDRIKLTVYDKDRFSMDDEMGDANIEIKPYLRCLRWDDLDCLPSPSTIARVQPTHQNCLAKESCIVWNKGKIIQDMRLRLRNVECGQVDIQIEWVDVPGNKGLPSHLNLD